MIGLRPIKQLVGVLWKDRGRYRKAISGPSMGDNGDPPWTRLRNRQECLSVNPSGPGVRCDWRWSSRLHACEVMPSWGRQLQSRACADWPIAFADELSVAKAPLVSFLLPHCGDDRLPQLCQVVRSIAAQSDIEVECVVTDLSPQPIKSHLPRGVVYQHVPTSHLQPGWYKSWAYNIAARASHGKILVFHDGDICVPVNYAKELVQQLIKGAYEAASIQRFLFYQSQAATERICKNNLLSRETPERVLQNWKGGTIAIRRDAFFAIGGFDEGFVDWGGEDDEFFDRCGGLRHLRYGYLPFLHLWHPSQPDRHGIDNLNETHVLPMRLKIPRGERVAELTRRDFGNLEEPHPLIRYKDQVRCLSE